MVQEDPTLHKNETTYTEKNESGLTVKSSLTSIQLDTMSKNQISPTSHKTKLDWNLSSGKAIESNEQLSHGQAFQRRPKLRPLRSSISSNFLPSKYSHMFEKNMHAVLRTPTSSLLNGAKEKTTQDISRYAWKQRRSQNSVSSRGIGYEKFGGKEYGSSWGGY